MEIIILEISSNRHGPPQQQQQQMFNQTPQMGFQQAPPPWNARKR